MMAPYREPGDPGREKSKRMYVEGFWWKMPASISMLALAGTICFAIGTCAWDSVRAKPCVESAEVIGRAQSERYCPRAGHMYATPLTEDHVLVRCTCAIDPDGGPPRP